MWNKLCVIEFSFLLSGGQNSKPSPAPSHLKVENSTVKEDSLPLKWGFCMLYPSDPRQGSQTPTPHPYPSSKHCVSPHRCMAAGHAVPARKPRGRATVLLGIPGLWAGPARWETCEKIAKEVPVWPPGPLRCLWQEVRKLLILSGLLTAAVGSPAEHHGNEFIYNVMLLFPWIPTAYQPDFCLDFKRKWLLS